MKHNEELDPGCQAGYTPGGRDTSLRWGCGGYLGASGTPHAYFSKPGQAAPNTVFKVILTFFNVPYPLPRLPPRHFQPGYPHMPGKARSPSNTIPASQASSANKFSLTHYITALLQMTDPDNYLPRGPRWSGQPGAPVCPSWKGAELLAEQILLSPADLGILFPFFLLPLNMQIRTSDLKVFRAAQFMLAHYLLLHSKAL